MKIGLVRNQVIGFAGFVERRVAPVHLGMAHGTQSPWSPESQPCVTLAQNDVHYWLLHR